VKGGDLVLLSYLVYGIVGFVGILIGSVIVSVFLGGKSKEG
jgi:hypothetical protein